jgi:hypothetical protein
MTQTITQSIITLLLSIVILVFSSEVILITNSSEMMYFKIISKLFVGIALTFGIMGVKEITGVTIMAQILTAMV